MRAHALFPRLGRVLSWRSLAPTQPHHPLVPCQPAPCCPLQAPLQMYAAGLAAKAAQRAALRTVDEVGAVEKRGRWWGEAY